MGRLEGLDAIEKLEQELKPQILDELSALNRSDEEKVREIISKAVAKLQEKTYLSFEAWNQIEKNLFNSLKRLDVIEELMQNPEITEIMINGPNRIFYEEHGKIKKWDSTFSNKERLMEVIQLIVGEHNRRVNTRNPIVDTRLADGSRVHVVLEPVAIDGPVVTIRRFKNTILDLDYLISHGTIPREFLEKFREWILEKKTILVAGGTGSGKTTLLNALSAILPEEERVITIEDCVELQLSHIPNLVQLECRDKVEEGAGKIGIRELIKASLRMRPDRLIVGEVRGAEALDLMQALNTGHQGSLSTIHANSCKDTFSRLETMMLMGMEMPLSAIRSQIAAGIDLVVHMRRGEGGERVIDQIVEVTGIEGGEITYQELFNLDAEKSKTGMPGNSTLA